MFTAKTAILALALSAAMATPSFAAGTPSPDWWMVYGADAGQKAQFVDLASVEKTARGTQIMTLAVDRAGKQERRALTINCAASDQNASLPAFICGSEAYRLKSGLNIRDFPPAEITRIYFRAKAEAQ